MITVIIHGPVETKKQLQKDYTICIVIISAQNDLKSYFFTGSEFPSSEWKRT